MASSCTSGPAPVLTMSLMVTGNLLGAGILALPINLGPAGMIPAVAGITLVWALMLYSAYVLADQKELASEGSGGLPAFFGARLGPSAKWLAVGADMVVFYGVLTAYLTGTATVVNNLFSLPIPRWGVTLAYFCVAAGLTAFGICILRRCNAVIMLLMGLTLAALIAMTLGHIDPARALPMQPEFLPAAMPIVLTAFLFHNLIPTLCREMSGDRTAVRRAILYGSLIGLAMNVAWTVAAFCALPMEGPEPYTVMNAFQKNLPATVPLSMLLDSKVFTDIGLTFAVLSMTAAFLANGTALLDFLRDLLPGNDSRSRSVGIWCLAFLPPLLVSMVYPDIFLVVMNVVGGFGICLLFGILPAMLRFSQTHGLGKVVAGAALCLFALILMLEACQELGLTHINPDWEYWQMYIE